MPDNVEISNKKRGNSILPFENENSFDSLFDSNSEILEEDYSIFPKEINLENYMIFKEIGNGSSSKVKLAININSNAKVALKIIPRHKTNPAMAKEKSEQREIRVLREVIISLVIKHPNIVPLLDFVYDDKYFYLIFEYVRGVSLYDYILQNGRMEESEARRIFRQILSAVHYLHSNGISHRDLKIENILITSDGNIKLIDFGLANFYDERTPLLTFCGSLYFAAPELLKGYLYKGNEVDIWSLGVVLYTMACGFVPFDDKDVFNLQNKIKNGNFEFPEYLSDSVKKCIGRMLTTVPLQRISLEDLLNDPWINEECKSKIEIFTYLKRPISKIDSEVEKLLINFMSFQFAKIKIDLKNYLENEVKYKNNNTKRQLYHKIPIVCLYNFLLDLKKNFPEKSFDKIIEATSLPKKVYQLVQYVINNSDTIILDSENGFLNKSLKGNLYCESTHPEIRNSIIKGVVNGVLSTKHENGSDLKHFIHNFCKKKRVILEKFQKNYFCKYKREAMVSYFKISLFFNLLVKKYIVAFKFICGEEELFNEFKKEFTYEIKL